MRVQRGRYTAKYLKRNIFPYYVDSKVYPGYKYIFNVQIQIGYSFIQGTSYDREFVYVELKFIFLSFRNGTFLDEKYCVSFSEPHKL